MNNIIGNASLRRLIAATVLITPWLLVSQAQAAKKAVPQEVVPADIVVTHAKVVTVNADSRIAEALAVRDGRIVALGSNAEVEKFVGADTRRIDAAGRTLIPGLIDSHLHGVRAGLTFASDVNWTTARSIPEALQRLGERAAVVGPGGWVVVGAGWAEQQFAEKRLPTQAEIDAALPDNPAWVQLRYIALLVNAKGRAVLQVDEDRLPAGFSVQRDAAGQPTGWWNASMASLPNLARALPEPSAEEQLLGTRQFFAELNRFGITGFIDEGGSGIVRHDALYQLWRDKALTVRVAWHQFAQKPGEELDHYKQTLQGLPPGRGDDWLKFTGIGESITVAMNNNSEPSKQVQEEFFEAIAWAAREDLAVSVHWLDIASVGVLLDLFERVNREVAPIAPLRWSIQHLDSVSPEVLARMAELGVAWSTHLTTYYRGDDQIAHRGDAVRRQPPLVTALSAGVKVAIGTDGTRAATYNPFVALQWALEGKTVRGTQLRVPSEIPTREQALRLYTINGAWFSFDEDKRGSLEVGKLADFAILDRDFFSVPVEQISDTVSLLTVVDGKIVYAATPFQ